LEKLKNRDPITPRGLEAREKFWEREATGGSNLGGVVKEEELEKKKRPLFRVMKS